MGKKGYTNRRGGMARALVALIALPSSKFSQSEDAYKGGQTRDVMQHVGVEQTQERSPA